MSGLPHEANGIVPATSAPPTDVAPTAPGYGVVIGAIEFIPIPSPPPDFMTEIGVPSFVADYEFEEYALEVVNGQVVKVNLSGQTIDWSQSELDETGELTLYVGLSNGYSLQGKVYTERQYTFLNFEVVLIEAGVPKPASWTVRMKHWV